MSDGVSGPCVLLALLSRQVFTWIYYNCLSFQTDTIIKEAGCNTLFQEDGTAANFVDWLQHSLNGRLHNRWTRRRSRMSQTREVKDSQHYNFYQDL